MLKTAVLEVVVFEIIGLATLFFANFRSFRSIFKVFLDISVNIRDYGVLSNSAWC
jgi:hypothetical protein